jgi:hypothetical protein
MRRTVLALLTALVVVAALGVAAVAGGGGSTVTRARLERALPVAFANLYVKQAHMLGRHGITPESVHARAMCDKNGPDVADVGPGGDWVCLMSWEDPQVPMPPEGYGKFEVNVHSNDCYTAGGPTKLTGYLTMTDARGREVTNPVFEFDGCFDPNSDNSPTGNSFPSLLAVTSTTLTPDPDGNISLGLGCGTGADGCAGTVTANAAGEKLGTVPFDIKEEATDSLTFPAPVPDGAKEVTFTVQTSAAVGPTAPVTLPVQHTG